ncbi:CPBP family intramembrane glutamic endopeptidase [Pseudonocardia sp.]|uniref:CPBP family intramembrane glutamic endopeptidase n=1 Tax=Pseudonocardia sp. TaxID=60912 RepID=UPI0026329ED5|nr:CPBP family intramembrane glutamic endopeptidase [Pseudonocardia sp.]MCW2716543.1 protease family protein [Pseudonocardia sp.]
MTLLGRAARVLPSWLTEKVPRDHRESDAAFHRRRKVVAATAITGAGVLGASLSTKPGSKQFYGLTAATAATWVVGGLASGPLHLGWMQRRGPGPNPVLRRPVVTPVLLGVGAFGAFYGAALVARRIPVLDRAISSVLQYADQGDDRLVLLTTLTNGAAEEVFFRGALYAALPEKDSVAASTGIYMMATVATRNPALVLASGVVGALFGLERRATGGIQAPLLTHLTWSALMLRYLPPLFRRDLAKRRLNPGR